MSTTDHTSHAMQPTLKGGLLALILLFTWTGLPVVYGQSITGQTSFTEAVHFVPAVVDQHNLLLGAAEPHLREQALQNIIVISQRNPAAYDWSAAGPALVRLYRSDPDPQLRIMAVAAVYTIGDKRSLDAINRHNAFVRHAHAQQRIRYIPSRAEQIGDYAVRLYYHTQANQRQQDRLQRRIDRHLAKANVHTEKALRLGHRMPPETNE